MLKLAHSPSQQQAPIPYGLVSLWDIMELLLIAPLVEALSHVTTFSQTISSHPNLAPGRGITLQLRDYDKLLGSISTIRDQSERLDFVAAVTACDQLRSELNRLAIRSGDNVDIRPEHIILLDSAFRAVSITFRFSARGRFVLSLPAKYVDLYEQKSPPFGNDVMSKFKTRGNYEIEEAAKCLALGRSTATAFHLMRAVECGVHAVRKCLNIPDPTKPNEKSWGFILTKIEDEIAARDNLAHVSPWMRDELKLPFVQIHASAELIKNWRDPTMHLEIKYTPDEAEHLYALTKGFMQKVASRMDEDGAPFA